MPRINPNETDKYQPNTMSEWISLKNDGDVARVQFLYDSFDDIAAFAVHEINIGDTRRYVSCLRYYDDPIELCPLCAEGFPVKQINIIEMFDHGDEKVKIWERGRQFLSKLQGLFNRYSPLSAYVFEIERHGKAGDTSTKYELFPMDRVDAYDISEVERPELLGGFILDKTAEEMDIYLDIGTFPPTEGEQQSSPPPVQRRGASRAQQSAPSGRRAASTPRSRSSERAPQTAAPQTGRRQSTRRAQSTDAEEHEVF